MIASCVLDLGCSWGLVLAHAVKEHDVAFAFGVDVYGPAIRFVTQYVVPMDSRVSAMERDILTYEWSELLQFSHVWVFHVEKVLVNFVPLQKPVSRAKRAFGSSAEPAFPQPRRAALHRVLCTKQMKVRIECIH